MSGRLNFFYEIRKYNRILCLIISLIFFYFSGKKKDPHIKKPLNAFMLYMKEMRPVVQSECTLKESAAINQILGRRVRIIYCLYFEIYFDLNVYFVLIGKFIYTNDAFYLLTSHLICGDVIHQIKMNDRLRNFNQTIL